MCILNSANKGTKSSYGPTFDDIGLKATLEAARSFTIAPKRKSG